MRKSNTQYCHTHRNNDFWVLQADLLTEVNFQMCVLLSGDLRMTRNVLLLWHKSLVFPATGNRGTHSRGILVSVFRRNHFKDLLFLRGIVQGFRCRILKRQLSSAVRPGPFFRSSLIWFGLWPQSEFCWKSRTFPWKTALFKDSITFSGTIS